MQGLMAMAIFFWLQVVWKKAGRWQFESLKNKRFWNYCDHATTIILNQIVPFFVVFTFRRLPFDNVGCDCDSGEAKEEYE